MPFVSDTLLVFRRQARLLLRQPAFIVIAMIQPLLFLILFGPLLTRLPAGTFGGSATGDAWRFFVPGLLIQLGLFGSTFVGFAIISDWRAGSSSGSGSPRYAGLAILSGRVLRDVVHAGAAGCLLVLVGVAFGLRAPVPAVLVSLGFIVARRRWPRVGVLLGRPAAQERGRVRAADQHRGGAAACCCRGSCCR